MSDDLKAIETVLQTYFDGLHEGDVGKLGAAFHESSDLRSVEPDGTLAILPRAQWFEFVKGRPSARSRDLPRLDRIVTIDRSGPMTAFAKVQCQIPPRYFTDYLTLAKLADGWKIVGKTFHTDTR
ncbi:MAG: nuclear transport factor 2 family protein [Alphaproteobacteria bacterium]|nr:nuclear transport factor 2 family protein [Alphaproteobacteria bacterium]